jgi:hypothetical protein
VLNGGVHWAATNSVILKEGWQLSMRKLFENRSKPVKKDLTSRLSPERRSRAPKWRAGQGLSNLSAPLVNSQRESLVGAASLYRLARAVPLGDRRW